MKRLIPVFIAALTFFFASCSNKSMDVAKDINTSYKYDGQTVTLEGRLSTSFMVWGGTDRKTLDLNLTCSSALDNTRMESVSDIIVSYGTGANSVIINVAPDAKEFKETDVALYDKNGTRLALTDKVKITGKVTYLAKGPKKTAPASTIKIPKVKEREEEGDGNDYSYKIIDVTIEKA